MSVVSAKALQPILDVRDQAAGGGDRRAMGWNGRIFLMDEPTAALGVPEQRKVVLPIQSLKAQKRGVVFHQLQSPGHLCRGGPDRGAATRQPCGRRIEETTHDEVMIGG